MRIKFIVTLAALLIPVLGLGAAPSYETGFGNPALLTPGSLCYPRSLTVDANGDVWVVDSNQFRLQRFHSDGTFVQSIGSLGVGDGQFGLSPYGLSTAPDGSLLAVDRVDHRVESFSPAGAFNFKFGTIANFFQPWGIAVPASGKIFVSDNLNGNIQRFSGSGGAEASWSVSSPRGLGVDASGNILVCAGNQVLQYSAAGALLASWGTAASGGTAGLFNSPSGVRGAPDGSILVADTNNHRIQRLSALGAYVGQWGAYGRGDSQFIHPWDAAADTTGAVYVADTGNHQVKKFSAAGVFLLKWGTDRTQPGWFDGPKGVASDATRLYVADSAHDQVQVLDHDGNTLAVWGSRGSGLGQCIQPGGLALDGAGLLYVCDYGNARMQVFDGSGNAQSTFGTSGGGALTGPQAVAVDANRVYVGDANSSIQVYAKDGTYTATWGGAGSGNGQFINIVGLAVDGSGNLYVADLGNGRVQVLNASGVYQRQWSTSYNMTGLALDASGNVLVGMIGSNGVHAYSPSGAALEVWAPQGTGAGQVISVDGIVEAPDGAYFLSDAYLNRVQRFRVPSTPTPSWTPSPSATLTASPTLSLLDTLTASPVNTATATPTPSLVDTATVTLMPSPLDTLTTSPMDTSSATPTPSPVDTLTASPVDTTTVTPTPSGTVTLSPTADPVLPADSLLVSLYNAAGEPLAQLYSGSVDAIPSGLTVSPQAFIPGPPGVSVGLGGCILAPTGPILWDGSVSGVWASPGSYYVRALVTDPYGSQTALVAGVEVLASPTPTVTLTFTVSPSPTVTPSPSGSPTATVTPSPSATPAYRLSHLGRSILAPVPLRGHQPLCLAFDGAPSASRWEVFNVAGERVADLHFGAQRDQCWDPSGAASGIYLVHLDIRLADGSREQRWQKVALLR
jgi:sugar lactone lactonase YvrE